MQTFNINEAYLKKLEQYFLKYYNDYDFVDKVQQVIVTNNYTYTKSIKHSEHDFVVYMSMFVSIYHLLELKDIQKISLRIYDNSYLDQIYYHIKTHNEIIFRNIKDRNLFINLVRRYIDFYKITNLEFNDDYSELYVVT